MALKTLLTAGDYSGTYTVVNADTIWEAWFELGSNPAASGYTRNTTSGTREGLCVMESLPPAVAIASVTVKWEALRLNTSSQPKNVALVSDTATSVEGDQKNYTGTGFNSFEQVWTDNPITGLPWTREEINSYVWGHRSNNGNITSSQHYYLSLEIDYTPVSAGTSAARLFGSLFLRLFGREIAFTEIDAPPLCAGWGLLRPIVFSHDAAPTSDGLGWGAKPWQRRRHVILSQSVNPEFLKTKIKALDTRRLAVSVWAPFVSELTADPASAEGIPFLSRGSGLAVTRDSVAYVERSVDSLLVRVSADDPKYSEDGLLVERAATNGVPESSFRNGTGNTFTGWTAAGTGSNGSDIVEDTGKAAFDSELFAARSVRFLAGNPIHAADLKITGTATASYAANAEVRVSIWHEDDTGSALYYALQRADTNYWRESDQTWQGTIQWNPMTVSTTAARYASKVVDVGGNSTTLTPILGIPTSGGVAGQINHAYHVQIEESPYATSVIHTDSTADTRAADDATLTNDHGARSWNPERGSFFFEFIPLWDPGDLGSGETRPLLDVYYNADNYDRVFYDKNSASVIFRRRLNAANTDASVSATLAKGVPIRIAGRWTGEGELNLSDYTLSVLADDVAGTDATPGGFANEIPAAMSVRLGSDGTTYADGFFQHLMLTDQVLDNTELSRLP